MEKLNEGGTSGHIYHIRIHALNQLFSKSRYQQTFGMRLLLLTPIKMGQLKFVIKNTKTEIQSRKHIFRLVQRKWTLNKNSTESWFNFFDWRIFKSSAFFSWCEIIAEIFSNTAGKYKKAKKQTIRKNLGMIYVWLIQKKR